MRDTTSDLGADTRPPDLRPLLDWLMREGRLLPDPADLLQELSLRLIACGVPVWRTTFHMPHLHPQLTGIGFQWREDWPQVERNSFQREFVNTRTFLHSPMGIVRRTGQAVRRLLTGPFAEIDFRLLEELRDQGGTEYLLNPLPLADGSFAGFSVTTKAPGGFTPNDEAALDGLVPAVAAVIDVHISRMTLRGLVQAYVGREPGERVLQGQVALGAMHAISAVVLISDMRGFTVKTETLPRREVLALLNDYFAAWVPAVGRAGGEVLKFLGDGMLAIFRITEAGEAAACGRAIAALEEAFQAIDGMNNLRGARGAPLIECGVGAALGDVVYGNIGAEDRLDFTVIGAAVNRAARLESLCKELQVSAVFSDTFAAVSPVPLTPLGHYHLKGVEHPAAVFGCPIDLERNRARKAARVA